MHQSNPSMSILHHGAFASVACASGGSFAYKPLPGGEAFKINIIFSKDY
jgi:hypothetical protein